MEDDYGRYFLSDYRGAHLFWELPSSPEPARSPEPNREAKVQIARAVAEEVVESVLTAVYEESGSGSAAASSSPGRRLDEAQVARRDEPVETSSQVTVEQEPLRRESKSSSPRKVLRWSESEMQAPPPWQPVSLPTALRLAQDEKKAQADRAEADFTDDDRPQAASHRAPALPAAAAAAAAAVPAVEDLGPPSEQEVEEEEQVSLRLAGVEPAAFREASMQRLLPPTAPLQTARPPPTPASSLGGESQSKPAAKNTATLVKEGPSKKNSKSEPMSTPSLLEMDEQLSSRLDDFFGDDRVWQQLQREVPVSKKLAPAIEQLTVVSSASRYRVKVPKPYPGVQYRRSKNLEDRYSRYAENGATVFGKVEPDGEWLRISGNVYLPVRVGTIHILEEVQDLGKQDQTTASPTGVPPGGPPEGWWACCPSSASKKAAEAQAQGGTPLQQAAQPMRSASGVISDLTA